MRYLLHILLALVTATATGFGLSYYSIDKGGLIGTVTLGPWVAWPGVGSPEPDPYTRAYIARTGALHLARAEGLRFTAQEDSDGETLDLACSYRVDGAAPVAAFWTLTATDPQGALVTAPDRQTGFHSTRIARDEDGSAVLRIGPQLASGNWLELSGNGPFELVMTVYDSSIFSGYGSAENSLPSITKERCA